MNTPRLVSSLVLLSALTLAGCATTGTAAGGKIADSSEYEYVTPVGSNIPVRVLKGQAPQTASPTARVSGDAVQNMMHSAPGQAMPDPGK
jgi:predicted small secreted protein